MRLPRIYQNQPLFLAAAYLGAAKVELFRARNRDWDSFCNSLDGNRELLVDAATCFIVHLPKSRAR